MKQPRPFQAQIIKETARACIEHRKVILQAPTGAGKTIIALNIIAKAIHKGNTVLVLTESTKIFNQLVSEFSGIKINADVKYMYVEPNRCYVAMSQSLKNRPKIIKQFQSIGDKLIIIADECHIGSMNKVIEQFDDTFMTIGMTATPDWRIAKHLPKLYKFLVHGPQVKYLISEGYLCDYKHIARTKADTSLLKLKNGEYTEESQDEVFSTSAVYDGLYEDLKDIAYKKCVIFVASIKQAEKLNTALIEHGYVSARYHSGLEDGQKELYRFTETSECNILVTIRSLSKGWNYPPIDCVVLMHATSSCALYIQEAGRASRPIPGVKNFFTLVDYGDNWKRHGLYHDDRNWHELWQEKKKKNKDKLGVMAVKMCDNCEAIIPATARKCEYCGHEMILSEKELQQGELVDITDLFSKLKGKRVADLTPEELAIYATKLEKKSYAIRIAKSQFLRQSENMTKTVPKEDDFLRRYALAMNFKPMWHHLQKKSLQQQNPIQPIYFKNDFVPL